MRFLLALLASLSLGLLLVLVEQLRRPLARLVRALLLGLTVILAIAGLAIGAAGIADDIIWMTVVGGGILAVALRLGWALRRRRPVGVGGEPEHVPLTRSPPDPRWRHFERGLDWVSRQQARQARAAIDSFVAERDSPSLTSEHRTLLLSCEKRVPELIDTCLDRCRNAGPGERRRYIDETLDRLAQLGTEAARARREVRQADDQRLQVLHRYFDGVAGPRDERDERL